MKIYKSIILRKLRLSEKFLQRILYARKLALGVGLMKLSIIIAIMALKLYLGYKRLETNIR